MTSPNSPVLVRMTTEVGCWRRLKAAITVTDAESSSSTSSTSECLYNLIASCHWSTDSDVLDDWQGHIRCGCCAGSVVSAAQVKMIRQRGNITPTRQQWPIQLQLQNNWKMWHLRCIATWGCLTPRQLFSCTITTLTSTSLLFIRYVTIWPWPLSLDLEVQRVSRDQRLYHIWAKSNNPRLSCWWFSKFVNCNVGFCGFYSASALL